MRSAMASSNNSEYKLDVGNVVMNLVKKSPGMNQVKKLDVGNVVVKNNLVEKSLGLTQNKILRVLVKKFLGVNQVVNKILLVIKIIVKNCLEMVLAVLTA